MTSLQTHPELPENALIVLIGASGAGKSTLARTWPDSQILSLDAMREAVSDDAGDQEATADAVDALHLILERRMGRRLNTVVDATNVTRAAREPLVAAAQRHNVPAIAVVVSTPASVCVERQRPRPANRAVPKDTVLAQHKAMVHSHPKLKTEGFNHVVFSDSLYRLLPLLKSLSETRNADLGRDGGDGLGDLLLVRKIFGPEILPMWRWKPGSDVAGGDRVAEIRLGQMHLTLALRTDLDGKGDIGFDVMVPCPHDNECTAYAWAPAYSVTCLFRALNGDLDGHEDIVCTVHGPHENNDQDDDPEGRADLEAQYAEAVRA
ncbi:ATP-binding protein [Streptomyces albireticuli]|uniref:ATP/GTP-binding protein n=1 Tax=Streptomyces albireticuli TaxID=1940 RepID=A0A2A2D6E2_9ACTN|nr:ATP-binding protein [Streptomyces albireticuli]MCD9146059.1 ATP-binding protein [Streptomyces albireticuli]MCD9165790.1 ATP-binding protein [Streptomyces albireticuli]MCD9196008.1 ATP-binding protein [Streptomyces albireticuli]PAU46900.1 ATP/GTP-binding protein [Streptomyces albireticuli]